MTRPMRAAVPACLLALALLAGAAGAHAERGAPGPVAQASIIGGGTANPAKWQFMAALLRKGRLHCGGSVISPTKVLTAAHCIEGFKVSTLSVAIGRTKLTDTATGESIGVAGAVAHPDFALTRRHDVGVITLATPTTAPAVDLPTPEEDAAFTAPGRLLRVAGWGARNPFGVNLARELKRTTERVRTSKRCRRAYRSIFSGAAMICALGKKVKRFGPRIHSSACSGDSGGPLVADAPTGPKAIGTVSFGGIFCGLDSAPSVYSRVSDSLGFITEQLAAP